LAKHAGHAIDGEQRAGADIDEPGPVVTMLSGEIGIGDSPGRSLTIREIISCELDGKLTARAASAFDAGRTRQGRALGACPDNGDADRRQVWYSPRLPN